MKQILLTCALAATTATAWAQTTDVSNVVGRYAGDLYIALGEEEYSDDARMAASVYLNQSSNEGCVNFSLPNFSFSGMALGNIDLPNINLTQNGNSYLFGENPNVDFNFLNGQILATANLNPQTSYVKGDSLVAYVPVMWHITSDSDMPIYVLFKGKLANPFQLENGDFNESSWQIQSPWDSKNGYVDLTTMTNAPEDYDTDYLTPSPWCISNVLGMDGVGATSVGEPVDLNDFSATDDNSDDENSTSNYAVLVENTPNPYLPSNVVPGYVTLGTSWATAISDIKVKDADGGAFGGVAFKGKPDALKFSYYHTFNEVDNASQTVINHDEPATVVAYLWKGTYKQEDVPGNTNISSKIVKTTMYGRDRNILGLNTTVGGATTKSDDAACIAQVVKSITEVNTTAATPLQMTVPLDYGKYAGTDITPDSLNIIFAANDYFGDRSKIGAGNVLIVDDVEFIYYHALKNVKQGNLDIQFDADNHASYPELNYDATKFTFTKVGEGATVEQTFNSDTNLLTIVVSSQEIKYKPEAYTTYTIQFGGDVTAVNNATVEQTNAEQKVYTLDGRKANTATRGAVIVNGKKQIK